MAKTKKLPGLAELIRNQKVFDAQREDLESTHHGEFALFSGGKLLLIVDTLEEANSKGYSECEDGKFTVIEIGQEPKSLGSARPYTLEEFQADGYV
ncbi:MAG: hypothetical protein OXG88_05815 [Gammaproteobacteria bacterium]|nr:hypothetical protein [Gammaproteobacteria bacterium]